MLKERRAEFLQWYEEHKNDSFFPHSYNTTEHQHDTLSCLPDKSYYDPDGMSKERRAEFLQ